MFIIILSMFIASASIWCILCCFFGIIIYFTERKLWNNGKCPDCGSDWYSTSIRFDDKNTYYSYTCRKCHNKTGCLYFFEKK